LATTLKAQGKYDEAHALYRKVLKIRRKCYREDHDMYADTLVNVANVYGEEKEFEEALKLQERASEIYARTLGEDSFKCATVRTGISCTQHMLGNSKIAQDEAKRAVRMFQKLGEVQNAWYANAVNILGYYGKQ
jgi:tetratricopeptide (TPR) repeat protein